MSTFKAKTRTRAIGYEGSKLRISDDMETYLDDTAILLCDEEMYLSDLSSSVNLRNPEPFA